MSDGLTCLSADSMQKVSFYNISRLLYRGQLREYKYDRVLSTLDKNFSSFNNSLCEFVFKKSQDEAGSLEQQPLSPPSRRRTSTPSSTPPTTLSSASLPQSSMQPSLGPWLLTSPMAR